MYCIVHFCVKVWLWVCADAKHTYYHPSPPVSRCGSRNCGYVRVYHNIPWYGLLGMVHAFWTLTLFSCCTLSRKSLVCVGWYMWSCGIIVHSGSIQVSVNLLTCWCHPCDFRWPLILYHCYGTWVINHADTLNVLQTSREVSCYLCCFVMWNCTSYPTILQFRLLLDSNIPSK